MPRTSLRVAAFVACLLCLPALVQAQGVLIVDSATEVVRLPRPWPPMPPYPPPPRPVPPPPPPLSYKIQELSVQARLVDQVAQVQVSQTFVNNGGRPIEAAFVFPLPYDGAVDRMTLLVDGKELPAKLLDAKEARRMYEEIVRRNRDPALLEWLGTGLFRSNVFPIPPGASRTVSLRYSQLCRKQSGLTDFLFPLSTAKYTAEAPDKIELRLTIESQEEIKNVYSPTHAVNITRSGPNHATITFSSKHEVPNGDFRLFYDVGRGKLAARVLSYRPNTSEDGYFLLLASPEIAARDNRRVAKTVLLVIDRSGSMSGTKIEQVRAALKHVLNNLHEGDLFNIIAYDSAVESFRPELQRYDETTRQAALGFVDGLYAGGSTDIDAALRTAFAQLQDDKRPTYVVFLTDGLPTAGETNEMKIVENARQRNKVRARLFAFGVGYDLNSRLLDKLVRENYGQSEYVRPNEDVEQHVARLYDRIQSPVLTNVKLQFAFDQSPGLDASAAPPINRVYPKGEFDLFAGEQLVVVGRYRRWGAAKVIVEGTLDDGERRQFDFPAAMVEKSDDETLGFVEKLWAVRRVGEILDELDLRGENKELITELVELSTRHGILTPYTSFMADEGVSIHDLAGNASRAGRRLDSLNEASGAGGVAQRLMKGGMQRSMQAPGAAAPADGWGLDAPGMALPFAGDAKKEAQQAVQNVRNIGNRTFYRRDGQWVDSQVTKTQASKAQKVKQFSDEYFALAQRHGRRLSQYLVFDEPVLLALDNQAYLIEP